MFRDKGRSALACAIVAIMVIAGGAEAQTRRATRQTTDDHVVAPVGPIAGTGESSSGSTGACCVNQSPQPLGACTVLTETACASVQGVYLGSGSTCSASICDDQVQLGACCVGDGKLPGLTGPCIPFFPELFCDIAGGEWQGPGSTCLDSDCLLIGIPGACCFGEMPSAAATGCQDLGIILCKVLGGEWQGPGTTCLSFSDPCAFTGETGACCFEIRNLEAGLFECEQLPQNFCADQGGTWQGPGTNCFLLGGICEDAALTGACCFADDDGDYQAAFGPECEQLSQDNCGIDGGTWQGPGTSCDTDGICLEDPLGHCCIDESQITFGEDICDDLEQAECVNSGGIWQGPGTTCGLFGGDICEPCPGSLLTIELLTDSFGGETTFEVVDENTGDTLLAAGPFSNNTLFQFSLCLPDNPCVTFTIYDSFGDGLCCTFGQGSYTVRLDGVAVCEGSVFGASESCLVGDGCEDCNENGILDGAETQPEPVALFEDDAEDDCGDAKHVGPGVYTGSNVGATNDGGLIACEGAQGLYDVWYRYRPAWDGPAIFSSIGSSIPVMITVHDSCPNGDELFLACATGQVTEAKVLAERKTDYWIRIAGVGAAQGDFQLTVVGPDSAPSLTDCNNNRIPDECECIGDLNWDATVDVFDAVLVWNMLGQTCTCPEDLDGNGIVDQADAQIVFDNLGKCEFSDDSIIELSLPNGSSNFGPTTGRKDTPPVFLPDRGF